MCCFKYKNQISEEKGKKSKSAEQNNRTTENEDQLGIIQNV